MPRTWHQGGDPNKPAPRPLQSNEEYSVNAQTVTVQIESKEPSQKDQKTNKSMTKTYHTIKDIISSRFKSNKESDDRLEEAGLNNVSEELRKSQANIAEETEKQKTSSDQQQGKQNVFFYSIPSTTLYCRLQ